MRFAFLLSFQRPRRRSGAEQRRIASEVPRDDREVLQHVDHLGADTVAHRGPPEVSGLGDAAGDHDDGGIEDRHGGGDAASDRRRRLAHDPGGERLSCRRACGDGAPFGDGGIAAESLVVPQEADAGADRFEMAEPAARAAEVLRAGSRHVRDLPGDVVGAAAHPAVDDDTRTDAGADRDDECAVGAARRAVAQLAHGERVDVVLHVHGKPHTQTLFQAIGEQPPHGCARPPGERIGGGDHETAVDVDHPGRADADGDGLRRAAGHQVLGEGERGADHGVRARTGGRGSAVRDEDPARFVDERRRGLRPADVDGDDRRGHRETASGSRSREARIYIKPDGTRGNKRGFTRKRDAPAFLASVKVDIERREFIDPRSGDVRIGELGAPG